MSPAPDQDPNPLISLFRRCVVCITDEQGRFRGSGFFAAPGRVVTCGHVVHGAATLRLQWQDQTARVSGVAAVPPLESVANPRNYPLPDLAVLNVDDAAGWGHPCAALTAEQPVLAASRDGLYLAGYTVEHGPTPALTGATTEFESLISEDGYTFFKLKRGLVLHGFSGSPLLDLRTGLVTGITESTRGADSDLGGFAVPAAELAAAFPELLEANRAFQLEDKRWNAAAEAEKTRAKERKGGRGRLPLRQPVVPLMPDEDLSPAKILRPRHAVVGYVGRQQLLAELADWCELEPDDGGPVGLWFVTGAGGFGKTRLAVEACREAEARGWTAGLLSPDVSPEGLQALAEWPGRLLIALDYAETAPVLAGRLTEELAARATRPAARVMLLVRRRASRAELLEWFNEQHEEQLDALLRHAQISRLDDEASEVDRLELFRQGTEDFSPFLGPPPVGLRVPRLRAAHFDRPLYVLAAAYLARASAGADVDALSEAGLLRALLDQHEAMHWARLDKQRDLGLHPADQRAAVAVATLITADGDDEALAVARLIPHLDGEPESRLIAVARWLAGLYPPAGGARQLVIAPLEPDRLGEILVGDVLAQHPGLLAAALDAASDSQLARALTVAGRVARDDQAVNAQLRDALDDRLPGFIQRCLGADGGDLLSAVTTATVISRPARGALESAGMFPNVLPIWARPLAVTITDIAVDGLRVQAGDDPTAVPHLAIWLNELANRLSAVGRQEEALETAGEAVAHYRQLAEASPAMYLPDLAGTLSNLAGRLSEVGQREEALQTAREAVAIGRQLAGASPAHLSGLAMSLNNLAAFLSAVGRREEGLETAREAVAIGRQLAEASPAAYLPDLATSLSNLANGLYTVGRREEGLEAAGEAVAIHRQLAEASPAAHLSGLATSLNNLAVFLSAAGRREEALQTAGEAVAIRRQLAEASPAAYLPDLAGSLTNLAMGLSYVGRREEALETAGEAVAHYRQLAEASPAAYLPDLTSSLTNLAVFLGDVGRREEALETAGEAVANYRQLAEASPAAYLPNLAMSLNNLASRLSDVGRREEALETAGEAVANYRQLAEANPAAYLPNLAMSLNNLAVFLSHEGRKEALDTAGEAVAIRRQLAEASPAAYLPDLATSLNNLANFLSNTGRQPEALETAGEAVAIRRQLAEASPAAYLPDLAMSLNNLASRLSDAGRQPEALETAGEAVANYRQLAEASPAAYLPNLATSLNNLANRLSEAGQAGHADQLFADVLGVFPDTTRGIGHILLARGRWRAAQTRLADAISDLAAAVSASDRDGDRVTRGQARRELRMLRENDQPAFDHAWVQVNGPIPVWLDHLTDTQLVIDKVLAWMRTPGWEASRSYLDDNAANLLTDEAQAATEHLIDVNPAVDTLRDYLELLKAARLHGADAAYASYQDQLLARGLTQTLGQWLAAPTWVASRAFAAAHGDSLLHPATRAILDDLNNKNPADLGLRLFRGLLGYAATVGFDAAYDLLPDTDHQRAVIADPATSAGIRLAVARMHSAQAADDPEAHFELAAITLLGIPDQANTEAASPLTREAAAALSDCTANAAPYERRDFVRRLSQLGAEHPALTPYIIELQDILTGNAAEALRREADTAFGVGGQRLLALRGVAGVDVPQHAEARVVGQHPLDLLPGQRRTVRHAHLPRVQRAADADPAAVVERHPRRPRRRVRHQVQQRPVRDRVGPVGHRLGLPVRGRDRAAVQVIAADHDRRGDLAGGDHLVEPHPGLVPLPVAEPADPGGQPLERDLLLRGADPPVQMLVLGEQRQHRLVRRVDVGGIAGQRRPPERALALGEQRPDVGGHEPGERERPREPAEPCLVADGVAVVEHLGARVLEAHHGSHVAGHRSTGPFSKFLRLFRGVVVPVSQFDADGQVRERVVRGRLVGDDVDGDAAPQQLGQHDRAVAHEPHRQRHARGPRGLAAPHRVVEVVGHHVQVPGRDAARKPPLIHVDH